MATGNRTAAITDFDIALAEGGLARRLFDATPDAVVVLGLSPDGDPEILYGNRAASKSHGYSREEFSRLRALALFAADARPRARELLRHLGPGDQIEARTRHVRKDGDEFEVDMHVGVVSHEGLHLAILTAHDPADARRLEAERDLALREAVEGRSRLRTIMDILPVGISLVGPHAEVIEVNRANAEIWRIAEQPKPQRLAEYRAYRGWDPGTGQSLAPDDWPVAHVMATGEGVLDRVVDIERFDGTRGTVEISAMPVRGKDGGLAGIVVLTIDVTERERHERLSLALDEINMLVHSTLDYDEIMRLALTRSAEALGAEHGRIMQLEDGGWVVREEYGYGEAALGRILPRDSAPHAAEAAARRVPVLVGDTAEPGAKSVDPLNGARVAAFAAIPLFVRGEVIGALGLLFREPQSFIDADTDFARKLGGTVSYALDNARLYEELSESLKAVEDRDRAIRRAYTDVIEAVTGGRLVLLGEDELDQAVPTRSVGERLVDTEEELVDARQEMREFLEGVPDVDDLVVAFCEALTNAIKHAGGGRYGFHRTASHVQLVVSDEGPGIDFKSLPKATLLSGFSTKQSLGLGFTLMMEFTDRVLLCTDERGTTVVLEKDL